ncbi:MAG TPA: AAA family ATPase [Actinomycetota bacterium]|nr:AAA family ATPase [Actinomycetota bacterium]
MADGSLRVPDGSAVTEPKDRPRLFVGRERELAELRAALAEADRGRGGVFLLGGEPGIGKSRLMEVVAHLAQESGWLVLTGRCWDGGGAPAYWPWVQIVRAAGGELDELVVSSPPGSADPLAPDVARFQLFDAVARFLEERARTTPLLVLLDDLHAADEPSLHLLRFIASSADDRRVVVVGAYREGELGTLQRAELFGEVARLGWRIPLRGLSKPEVASFLTHVAGEEPSDQVVERVRAVTGGNPFFLGEIGRELASHGNLHAVDEGAMRRLPEEVRAFIRRHFAALSPEAVSTLRVAAVLGRDLDLKILTEASSLNLERLASVLDEAVRVGVLSEDARDAGQYSFAHDLVRETLYEDLSPATRMELHLHAARVFERVYREDLGPHLTAIAHHFAQAAPLGDVAPAVDYSLRAAARAIDVLAYEDAAALLERTLPLLPPEADSARRRAEILIRLGDARTRAGDTEGGRACYEQVAVIARDLGDPTMLADAALAHASRAYPARLGLGTLIVASIFDPGTRSVALLEEAVRALPAEDSSLRARTLARLATELYQFHQTERLDALSHQALDMALRVGDPKALVEALHGRHWATLSPDSIVQRLANAQEMLLVATGAANEEAAFLARHARVHCHLELCDMPGLDGELSAMEQLSARIQQPFYLWHVAALHGMRALLQGRTVDAERIVGEALEIGRVRESEYVTYMHEDAQILAIRWTQGRMEEVRDRVSDHGERYPDIPRWRNVLLAAELGDDRAARAEVERHARHGFADLPRDGLWLLHMCGLAQAAALIGDERRAALLYDLLLPFVDRNAISISTLAFGPVAMRLGSLASSLGRWERAEQHFDEAAERCEALGARAVMAMLLVERARMWLARAGPEDADRARAALDASLSISEDLDLAGIAERARAALPGPSGSVDQDDAAAPEPTSQFLREGQYWTIRHRDEMARLPDRKGMRYLAELLRAPGREVHVLELLRLAEPGAPSRAEAGLESSDAFPADAILDPRAKREYRQRLLDLEEDLAEAESMHDVERVGRSKLEIDAITHELVSAAGLGGRDRRMPTPAERARVSVTKAIRGAVRAIAADCPELGSHLEASVRTGRLCSYSPPAEVAPVWKQ